MRIISAYCPHCDANRRVECVAEGDTSTKDHPGVWYPALVMRCPEGHAIARFGVLAEADRALELMLRLAVHHAKTGGVTP